MVTTSRIDDPSEAGRLPDEPDDAPAPARRRRRRLPEPLPGLLSGVGLVLVAVLPALLVLRRVLRDRGEPYLPVGDQAIFELSVRDVGQHEVLLGAYSRLGWYHPGPMGAYVMAVPYRLLDGGHDYLAVGALAVAAISSAGAVLLVRRGAGLLAAVWALLVVATGVRLLGADFLRDSWNPTLPVLPLLVGALLCWAAIRGDAWALPVAVVPLSFAVQSHIGYLPPVGALAAVLAAGLLVRALRHWWERRRGGGRPGRYPGRWAAAFFAAVAVGLLLWLPPIAQQLTGDPGNLGVLADYVQQGPENPTVPVGDALRSIADEFGKFPAYVADAPPGPHAWSSAVGVVVFVAALAVGLLRRREDVLWLGALTLAVAAAGVAAIARIDGPWFLYMTRWTAVVGILAWLTVGLALLPELMVGVRHVVGRVRPVPRSDAVLAVVAVPLAVLATIAAFGTGNAAARAETPSTDVTGEVGRLEEAVVADLDRLGLRTVPEPPVVRVDFAPTTRPELVGTFLPGSGLVLGLVRDGVDVQLSDHLQLQFGARYTERAEDAGYVVTIAYADGSSPPPEPWQRVLLVGAEFQVYGGALPVG